MGLGNQLAAHGALGLIGGAALGVMGGALGGRSVRARQHERATAEWERLHAQRDAFERSVAPVPGGAIAAFFEEERRILRRLFGSEPDRLP